MTYYKCINCIHGHKESHSDICVNCVQKGGLNRENFKSITECSDEIAEGE